MAVIINELDVRAAPEGPSPGPVGAPAAPGPPGVNVAEVLLVLEHRRRREERLRAH